MTEGQTPEPVAPRSSRIGVYGLTLMFIAAVFLVLSFTALSWYRVDTPGISSASFRFSFSKLHDVVGDNSLLPSSTRAYFGWLAWTLAPVLIVVGVLANLPSRFAPGLRLLGLLVGAFGVSMTYFSFDKLNGGHHLDHARPGVWLALIGFAVGAVGSALGPPRAAATISP
ncbi:MAG TPA: hypothetical protein VJ831_02650 [Jatrophihabitantaceae bacterium]|nr:hypothetical protein [Jatrophihabitantaceae bacterium]